MLQTDSIQSNAGAGGESVVSKHYQLTPAKVLSWYSRSLSPSQQDSIIQLYFKPKEIRWSQRADTLHLPGHTIGKSVLDASLPQYYKESFFSQKEYFHPEIQGGRKGVAGDPVPYNVSGDNFITSLLLLCFIFTAIIIKGTANYFSRRFKSILYSRSGNIKSVAETSGEVVSQIVLVLETCLLAGILFVSYLREFYNDSFIVGQIHLTLLFSAIFLGIIVVKQLLYSIVGSVFFDGKKNKHWIGVYYFIVSLIGILLLPLVTVKSFFNLSYNSSSVFVTLIFVLYEFMMFYSLWQIFFTQKGRFLQNILYFCMLEIVPISIIWYILTIISEQFKINF